MLRQVVVVMAGLTMAAGVALAGVDAGSAASPALHVKPNAIWTFEVSGVPGCEQDQFNTATHMFVADGFADSGSWSGGMMTISMAWTTGANDGLIFSGHFVRTAKAVVYKGSVNDANLKAKLIKGAVAGC